MQLRRVQICGNSGSGKTSLARALAAKLEAPHVELDELWHRENWTTTTEEEFRASVSEATAGDKWIVDGNYSRIRELIWPRTDLVVWLDYSLPVILGRLTRRTFRRWFRREVLWHGNRERLWRHLLVPRDSLYWWVLTTYRRRRRECARLATENSVSLLRFARPEDADRWLRSLE